MNIHKNTRLTPHQRQAVWRAYTQDKITVTSLARQYQVSRVTIYRILKAARLQLPAPQNSTNNRFKQAKYGMKRLAKVEKTSKKSSRNRPNATTNPIPAKWCISTPNDCLCCKTKKQPPREITCLSPLTTIPANYMRPFCPTVRRPVRPSSFCVM